MDHGAPRTAMVRTGAGAQPAVIAIVIALAAAATGGSGKTSAGDLQPPMAGTAQHSQGARITPDGAGHEPDGEKTAHHLYRAGDLNRTAARRTLQRLPQWFIKPPWL